MGVEFHSITLRGQQNIGKANSYIQNDSTPVAIARCNAFKLVVDYVATKGTTKRVIEIENHLDCEQFVHLADGFTGKAGRIILD